MSELQVICARVRELDRLYLAHDALLTDMDAVRDRDTRRYLERRRRRAWAAYANLRDADSPGRPGRTKGVV